MSSEYSPTYLPPILQKELGERPPVENPPSRATLFALNLLGCVCGALSILALLANVLGGLFMTMVLFGFWSFLLYTAKEVAATGGTAGTFYRVRRLNTAYTEWENRKSEMLHGSEHRNELLLRALVLGRKRVSLTL